MTEAAFLPPLGLVYVTEVRTGAGVRKLIFYFSLENHVPAPTPLPGVWYLQGSQLLKTCSSTCNNGAIRREGNNVSWESVGTNDSGCFGV